MSVLLLVYRLGCYAASVTVYDYTMDMSLGECR